MTLSEKEFGRIYELMKWGVEKQNLQDPHFLSAYKKIESLHEIKGEKHIICADSKVAPTYSTLSDEAKSFIDKRIEEGYKNTYHSIMSVLGDRLNKKIFVDKDSFREEYIARYNISPSDLEAFDEVYNAAFSAFSKKHKSF